MPNWSTAQYQQHLVKRAGSASNTVNTNKQVLSTVSETFVTTSTEKSTQHTVAVDKLKFFSVPGDPMGKPRMTRSDKWKTRPVVLRYRAYCDKIRACAGTISGDPYALIVNTWIAMPSSWSTRKKQNNNGRLMRSKPDADNIIKAVSDALFKEDSVISGICCWKFWCEEGQQRTDITVLYL